MAKEKFSGCQYKALRGKVHGRIGGLHGDVDAFKMDPHGRGGIGEAAVEEGVGGEKEAEVVWDKRQGNGAERKDSEP